ncbi:MAG: bifunctional isocitrate dehydrogenase kinase/phosphatase, partial [Desulfatitalea sp.]|nr:bifunctional isocitrate dehydrogenase kinase/phosphatase [Desulfatitalea sp.]NNJ99600.1 bifunctional isocitrate dehydrogenase kinase/phosphatase [Desulfatitalea sp.]
MKREHTAAFQKHSDSADRALDALWLGFTGYGRRFEAITRRAADHFAGQNWPGMRRDTVARLDLYQAVVSETCRHVADCLGLRAQDPTVWRTMKRRFSDCIDQRHDSELAATFYNSVNRRMLQTVGIEPELEFVAPASDADAPSRHDSLLFNMDMDDPTAEIIESVLKRFDLPAPYAHLRIDARLCAERIRMALDKHANGRGAFRIEMVTSPFYREMGAYLIGRIVGRDLQLPLVFALGNGDDGLYVDALLLRSEDIRILFSFSHTYFHVLSACPRELVRFLKALMPSKRVAELYIGLGYNKHGKTELYRDLLVHQRVCSLDRFDFSPGQRGMVMIAFNMPQDDLVYKLIRDRFAAPKHATHQQVMGKYEYVFKHDRAGRLVDVQTFENLQIEDCCFAPELLAEIENEAQRTTTIEKNRVILHHVYVERRMMPLDLYLRQADTKTAEAAVIEYGWAIKDLARINIFPGDLLIKNFGVTQLGRVVFYDYDELCPLTDCNFRRLP